MPWKTKDELAQAVKSSLGLAPNEPTPGHWTEPIAAAVVAARGVIVSALAARGFTIAQINAWDRLGEFHRAVGLCRAFRDPAIAQAYDTAHLDKVCEYIAELAEVPVTVDGELIDPDALLRGRVSYGDFDTTHDAITTDFEA